MVNTLLNADGEDVVISEFAYTYYADGNQRTRPRPCSAATRSPPPMSMTDWVD